MSIRLIAPRPGKTPYYAGRGVHHGVFVNERSTRTGDRKLARKIIRRWEREIEAGLFVQPGELTFARAAISYMQAGGERRPLAPIIEHFGDTSAKLIDQAAIDACAAALFPDASDATRNREVYTPVSCVLKHNGIDFAIKRPKGARGQRRRRWLWPEQAFRILAAAKTIDVELWILCVMLLYGGLRISEQLAMRCDAVRVDEAFAHVPDSKNGEAQPVHLTPFMVDALRQHPRGLARPAERLFRFHKGGGLDFKLIQACALASGLEKPKRAGRGSRWPDLPPYEFDWVSWHVMRHTYASWGRRYLNWDTKDQVDTGRWRSEQAAGEYAHSVAGEAARETDRLPVPRPAEAAQAHPRRSRAI